MKQFTLSDKTAILVIQKVIAYGLGIIRMMLFARLFTKEIYGSLRQLGLIQNFITPIAMLSLPSSLMYFIPATKDHNEKRLFVSQTIYFLVTSSAFFVGILMSTSPLISEAFNNSNLKSLIPFYVITIFFMVVNSFFIQTMYAFEKVLISAISSLIFKVIALIVVFSTFIMQLEIQTYLLLIGATLGLEFLISILISSRIAGGLTLSIRKELLKRQFSYSLPLALSSIVSRLTYNIDLLMISFFYNPVIYAIYSVGATEFPLSTYIRRSAANVALPRYVQFYTNGQVDKMMSLFHEVVRKSSIIIMPFFAYLLFMSHPIIITMFSEKYIESVNIFRIYLFIIPLGCVNYGSILRAVGNTRPILNISIIFVLVNSVLNLLFIKAFGIIGPAIATVISITLIRYLYIRAISKSISRPFLSIYPLRLSIKILALSVILLIPIFLITDKIDNNMLTLVISAIIYLPCFILIFKEFGLLTKDDFNAVKRWMPLLGAKRKLEN